MKKFFLIGFGTGNPEHLTVEALRCLGSVNVFFIFEKASEKNAELAQLRRQILKRYLPDDNYRIVSVIIPERKKAGQTEIYKQRVEQWRAQKAKLLAEAINTELQDNETGALLIWGDPCLYDGHIEVLNYIMQQKLAQFEFEVIPGITSVQVLAARHKISLNAVGEKILLTTGRRFRELDEEEIENAVVLLDNYQTYKKLADSDMQLYWGCYLGTEHEHLISGAAREVVDKIIEVKKTEKARRGWIMETYLVRHNKQNETDET